MTANDVALNRTPLRDLHVRLGAKMVPFAGYEMPLNYPAGVLKEHLHVRFGAGLFDVSHMGQVTLRTAEGRIGSIAQALEALIPIDIEDLPPGRQRYGFLLDDTGGILDDVMVTNGGDHIAMVVNAANKVADVTHLRAQLPTHIDIALSPNALLALQGPRAEDALAHLTAAARDMRFMDVRAVDILCAPCTISRSGYTGEDGFELSVPAEKATEIAEALLAGDGVLPIGLGARDSLRLEAGLCLHGADIGPDTTPVEAGLAWAISPARRAGGARPGGFPGATRILAEMAAGPRRRRVGLRPDGRTPVRAGASLFATAEAAQPIGHVTSGGFGPSVQGPVAMATVPTELSAVGTPLFADVRGQRHAATVCAPPFVPPRFKRAA